MDRQTTAPESARGPSSVRPSGKSSLPPRGVHDAGGGALAVFLALALSACERDPETPQAHRHSPLFTEITAEVGLPEQDAGWPDGQFRIAEFMGPGVALFDADGDGDLDLLVPAVPPPGSFEQPAPNRFFRRDSSGVFRDESEASGLADPSPSYGIAVGDADNDGDRDVYVGNLGRDRFYRNRGDGTFEDATEAAGFTGDSWTCSAAFLDYDRDGDLDLFAAHYIRYDPAVACSRDNTEPEYCSPLEYPSLPDSLYRNNGDGTFTDVSAAAGIVLPANGLGVVCADLDGDGWTDVYVANDAQPNHLWINQQDGTFLEEAYLRGAAVNRHGKPEASMGVALGDCGGDGRLDLFMTHLAGENNTLYRAEAAGAYRDSSVESGLGRFDRQSTGFGCAFTDLDLDGDLDLLVANGRIRRGPVQEECTLSPFWRPYAEQNQAFLNRGDCSFEDAGARGGTFTSRVEVSRGLALGDLDRDGDMDFVVANHGGPVRVYRNDAGAGHWLEVSLLTGGRDALGAEVRLNAGGRSTVAVCLASSSYASSSEPVVHFGLGPLDRVDSLEVRWPDGRLERFPGGAADRRLELVQGTGETP